MIAAFLAGAFTGALIIFLLHPVVAVHQDVKDEVEKIETELSIELARTDSLHKFEVSKGQARARGFVQRIKALL
jgi:hypothetical protein